MEMSDDAAIQATNVPAAAAADVAVSGQITVAVVLLIVALFVAILILYLRSRGGYSASSARPSGRRRLSFAQQNGPSASRRNALDRSILESLPVAVCRAPEDGERAPECAVCLCELAEGEEARFLPKCRHAFHVECIDMWFGSNSTCPLCRLPVAAHSGTNDVVSSDQEQGSTSSSSSSSSSSGRKELAIEIPRRAAMEGPQGFSSAVSPLPSTRRTPVAERLRSLGRMMSSRGMGKGVCCSTTTTAGSRDIEQGPIDDDVSKQQ